MSSIVGSITGVSNNTAAGSSGLNYRGSTADITNPVTGDQTANAYGQAQNGLAQQQALLQALQAQNGLQNQSNTFNQLQGVANGTGPNPAQAQLAQATAANTANQAALMAGQRGSGANAGLIARQAANQGAGLQQQAAGQAATLQANQSLGALNQMGALATNQANQQANAISGYSNAAQGEQGQLLGAVQGVNNANVGMTSNINTGQATLANTAATGQQGLLGQVGGAVGSIGHLFAQGGEVSGAAQPRQKLAYGTTDLQPATSSAPASKVGQFFQGLAQSAPSPQAAPNPVKDGFAQGAVQGAALGKAGKSAWNSIHDYFSPPQSALGSDFGANMSDMNYQVGKGPLSLGSEGVPSSLPQGGLDSSSLTMPTLGSPQAPSSTPLLDSSVGADVSAAGEASETGDLAEVGEAAEALAKGGRVKKIPALMSPGEQYLGPRDVKKVVKEGKSPLSVGERIPGKPKFPGNDYRNDVVKKNLDEGGFVIPNEIMQSKDASKRAAAFVKAHLSMQSLKKGK